jgi:hypothetical protein
VPSSQTSCPSVNGLKWCCPFLRSVYFLVIACARLIAVWAWSRRVFRWAMRCSISGMFVIWFGFSRIRGVKPIKRSKGVCPVVVLGQELCAYWAIGSHCAQLSCW